jgi:signal transduction histidine kinase
MSFFLWRIAADLDSEYKRNLDSRTRIFRDNLSYRLTMGDYVEAVSKSNQFSRDPDVAYLRITLSDGSELVNINGEPHTLEKVDLYTTIERIEAKDPVENNFVAIASLEIGYSLSKLREIMSDFLYRSMTVILFFVLCSIMAVYYFTKILNRPLMKLAKTVSTGNLAEISLSKGNSIIYELSSLESAIGEMGAQIINLHEKEKELTKDAAVGLISAQITHDMRAPIGIFERLLLAKCEDIPDFMPAIREAVNRLYTMVEALRRGETENIVRKFWTTLDFRFGYDSLLGKACLHKIMLIVPSKEFRDLYIDSAKVERAWINLASNAIEFAKSTVQVEAELVGSDVIIRVIDDGPGVPEHFLPILFKRGATHGKSDGTGLGLSYSKQVMMGHGGDIRYYRENNLTVFECFIPNAFGSEPAKSHERTHTEPKSEELQHRNTGIVFRSSSLCSEVLDKLKSIKTETMRWHEGFNQGHDFIITDDPNIVDQCIDKGISVAEFKPNTPVSEIVRRTLIRLGIPQSERTEDV